jgi:transglutaminase-like putative cysteine protease
MLRPRDSHALRVVKTGLTLSPPGNMQWTLDVFGNSIAVASFLEPTRELRIDSALTVEPFAAADPQFQVSGWAVSYPFAYSADERMDLGALLSPHYADPAGRLGAWARSFVLCGQTGTLALLTDLNTGISAQFRYQSRDEEGTQTPLQTMDRGWGACRDFAVLLVEAARWLGIGARLVSGYVDESHYRGGVSGFGATHAWAELYLPGAGWITFDPTNGTVGDQGLIRVAVGRTMGQIIPVSGSFVGTSGDFQDMTVQVAVTPCRSLS